MRLRCANCGQEIRILPFDIVANRSYEEFLRECIDNVTIDHICGQEDL